MFLILYAVVEEGYEYNDEIYSRPECGGYEITSNKLYQTEKEAKEACKLLNSTQSWKGHTDYDNEEETLVKPFKVIQLEL